MHVLRASTNDAIRVLALLLIAACAAPVLGQVTLPITITKSFSPSTVPQGGTSTTTMTVTITNPNSFTVSGIAFSDTYPAGLVPDVVGAYTCGTLGSSALFNASGWSFTNVTLGAGASCNVPMLMHATNSGVIVNMTSQVTATQVPTGGPASASLNVTATPIPALSQWSLLLLAAAMATIVAMRLRM